MEMSTIGRRIQLFGGHPKDLKADITANTDAANLSRLDLHVAKLVKEMKKHIEEGGGDGRVPPTEAQVVATTKLVSGRLVYGDVGYLGVTSESHRQAVPWRTRRYAELTAGQNSELKTSCIDWLVTRNVLETLLKKH